MKMKVDHYRVPGKRRIFDILVFPSLEYAWVYDDYPEEPGPRIDGDCTTYQILLFALAVLIEDPSKIIFFPVKKGNNFFGFGQTYHLVLLRPELQFRRSEWPTLHAKLNRKHWVGKYDVGYNRQKLCDYYDRFLKPLPRKVFCKYDQYHIEEIRGDTVFMVIPKDYCYDIHTDILNTLASYGSNESYGAITHIGWIYSEKIIQKYRETGFQT